MTIEKNLEGGKLVLAVEGRLDTVTAPELEKEVKQYLDKGVTEVVMDFSKLNYISSAGLRVLLSTNNKLRSNGSMKVINANETVMEIFEVTGFTEILTIE